MVTEGAYGQLKGRWRVLLRNCESTRDQVRTTTLACLILHNVYIDRVQIWSLIVLCRGQSTKAV